MKWTNEQLDTVFERLLPCEQKNVFERELARIGKEFNLHQPNRRGQQDGDPVRRVIWGVAVGAREYQPLERTSRVGKPWSYVEIRILQWAFPADGRLPAESKKKPSEAMIAGVLQRLVNEIKQGRVKYGPSHGIVGFGFGAKNESQP